MSHHLLSKKCWLGFILLPCIFFGMVWAGFVYIEREFSRVEVPVQDSIKPQIQEEILTENQRDIHENTHAFSNNNRNISEDIFPCRLQMKKGVVGIYGEEEQCIKEYKQAGEYMSEKDRMELQRGIWVENEQELVMLLESFHLQ